MTSRARVGAASLATAALAAALAAPAAAQEGGLTVQRSWRLLAVGLGAGPEVRPRRLLGRAERGLRRELPGLDVRFDRGAWRDVPLPEGAAALDDDALVAFAVQAAEALGVEPADYDVVFVLSPAWRAPYFGEAHVEARDRRGRAVRAARIHTAPGRLIVEGLARTLAGESPAEGLPPGRASGPGRALGRTLERLRPALTPALDRGLALEAIVLPTIAHELGHFFAPGDRDIRDGYQAPWLRHATGPDDNPEGHGVECVMFKGRDAAFYARKALATGGRLVRFCDRCRERLGCRGSARR
ncbi:MAG: hypothetical protein M9894_04015 [Planctomycetes bacterium]|nr:hypothetical protein [Planctomycetota bacterium]